MFEVGKKYKHSSDEIQTCVFVGEIASFFRIGDTKRHAWIHNTNENNWLKEVPPEPKRWSEWFNYHTTSSAGLYDDHWQPWLSFSDAVKTRLPGSYTLQYDWEQEAGKDKRLIKAQLVGVPD